MRTKGTFWTKGLLLLALLPGLGGCGGGGRLEAPRYFHFGPDTPEYLQGQAEVPRLLVDQTEPGLGGKLVEEPFYGAGYIAYDGYSRMLLALERYFFGHGYLSLPGFPEHRFLLSRRAPYYVQGGCFPEEATGKCRTTLRLGFFLGDARTLVGNNGYVPLYTYPPVVGRDGRTDTAWEYEVVYRLPAGLGSLGPHIYFEDAVRFLEYRRDEWWGKGYGYRLPYRVDLGPGLYIHQRPPERAVDLKRLPELDARPMVEGYFLYGREAWYKGYTRDLLVRDRTLAWTHEDYYAFERASGPITPPYPICIPGEGYTILSLVGPYMPRLIPTQGEPHPRIPGVWNHPWYEYMVHAVLVEEREAPRVAAYMPMYYAIIQHELPEELPFYGRTRLDRYAALG